jgi:hypothetical protein
MHRQRLLAVLCVRAPLLRPRERVVDHAGPIFGLLVVRGPFGVEIGQRIRGQHLLLGLAFIDQFLDAVARGHKHLTPRNQIPLVCERAMAGHDLGLVVRHLEEGVGGADQASDVAAIGEIDGVVAAGVAEGVAGVEHVGIIEEDPGVAVGVRILDVVELRLAAADLHRLGAAGISVGRQGVGRLGRHLRASQAVGGVAGGETDPDVVLRHDGGAVLVERRIPAGVIA